MYVPEQVEVLLQKKVTLGEVPIKYLDQYRFIAHSIAFQRLTDKRHEGDDCYVPLNLATLRRLISQGYAARFRDNMIDWKIIECNGLYSPKRHISYGYRFTEPYRHDGLIAMSVSDPLLAKNISLLRNEQHGQIRQHTSGYATVDRWLQAVTIDKVKAGSHIERHFPDGGDKHNARALAVDAIDHKEFWCVVDRTAGRAHHNLSNLASDLRPFLSIDGRPLEQIDIANSQPLFMHLLFCKTGNLDSSERATMEPMLLRGKFYGLLNEEQLEIGMFKDKFYQYLFGDSLNSSVVAKRFMERFPSYSQNIEAFKRGDYRRFAVLLQSEEAKVVYDAVQRFADKTNGTAPILTVHDSLVTTPDHINMARDALEEAFLEMHGIRPLLRHKKPTTDISNSSTNKTTKNMETALLTCISIESSGIINGKAGNLIRFIVKFAEGFTGEYWGRSEESKKNFPLNVPRYYEYEPLTKKFGEDTLKFYPMSAEKAKKFAGTASVGQPQQQRAEQPRVKTYADAGADAVAAVSGSVRLVAAGKIELAQMEPTAVSLKDLIKKLSNA